MANDIARGYRKILREAQGAFAGEAERLGLKDDDELKKIMKRGRHMAKFAVPVGIEFLEKLRRRWK